MNVCSFDFVIINTNLDKYKSIIKNIQRIELLAYTQFIFNLLNIYFYLVSINLKLTPKLVDETGKVVEISGVLICRSKNI